MRRARDQPNMGTSRGQHLTRRRHSPQLPSQTVLSPQSLVSHPEIPSPCVSHVVALHSASPHAHSSHSPSCCCRHHTFHCHSRRMCSNHISHRFPPALRSHLPLGPMHWTFGRTSLSCTPYPTKESACGLKIVSHLRGTRQRAERSTRCNGTLVFLYNPYLRILPMNVPARHTTVWWRLANRSSRTSQEHFS